MLASTASFLVVIRCPTEEVEPKRSRRRGRPAGGKETKQQQDEGQHKKQPGAVESRGRGGGGGKREGEGEHTTVSVRSPPLPPAPPPPASADEGEEEEEEDAGDGRVSLSTKTLHLPDYDWLHVQEITGAIQLYRHAPRYESASPTTSVLRPPAGPRPAPPSPPPRRTTAAAPGGQTAGGSIAADDGPFLVTAPTHEEEDRNQHYYTPFRSGRLSTLLVMGVPRDMPATAILSCLAPVSTQLRSIHILRDPYYGHRTFLLLTLESPEAAERLHHAYNNTPYTTATTSTAHSSTTEAASPSSSSPEAWGYQLPGTRSLFVSGIVLVEPEGAAVLSCMRSVMGAAEGLVHQGIVPVTPGPAEGSPSPSSSSSSPSSSSEAHCLILASQENALSFLSSLVVDEHRVASKGIDSYLAELPTCLQCLDKIDPSILQVPPPPLGSFPCRRVSTSTEDGASSSSSSFSCPVCRSVKKYTEGPMACSTCQIPENLWICLLCAHVGCGRYTKEHAKQHFHQTGHILSLELATGRAWDYVEDVFVHIMTMRPLGGVGGGAGEEGGGGGAALPPPPPHGREATTMDKDDPQQAKLAGLAAEYNALLASQLDEQLRYYEQILAKTAADWAESSCQEGQLTPAERIEADQARAQIQRLEEEVEKVMRALREAEEHARQMRARNEGLLEVQRSQKDKVASIKAMAAKVKERYLEEQQDYEQQIQDLTFFLRTQEAVKASPQREELEGGHLVVTGGSAEGGSSCSSRSARARGRLRKRGR